MPPLPCRRYLIPALMSASALNAQPSDRLTPGTYRYHLVEQTQIQNSLSAGPGAEIRRDLYFALTLIETSGQLEVRMRVDSAIVTSAQIGRLPQTAFANAEWRGTMTPQGTGVQGSLVLANGSPTASPVVAPLRWILPVLARENASDAFEITTVAQSGAQRTIRASRTFSRASDTLVTMRGRVEVAAAGELKINEVAASTSKDGTLTGRWTLDRNGALTAATMGYEIVNQVAVPGGETMKTSEQTTITLTRRS